MIFFGFIMYNVLNNIINEGYDAFLIGSMEEKTSNKNVYFDSWGF